MHSLYIHTHTDTRIHAQCWKAFSEDTCTVSSWYKHNYKNIHSLNTLLQWHSTAVHKKYLVWSQSVNIQHNVVNGHDCGDDRNSICDTSYQVVTAVLPSSTICRLDSNAGLREKVQTSSKSIFGRHLFILYAV